uniref:EXPERA domain-containing protein n=1 Tax=Bionectria ochroleuca TaxID=29856 RepID=A0A8H7KEG4_BIOOC
MAIARYLDKVYLFIVGTQLFGIPRPRPILPQSPLGLPSAPLHFLVALKAAYTSYSGDPFFAEPAHEPWFQACILIEGLVQLPLCAYLAYKLASSSASTDPRAELAGIAFGCTTGFGAAVSCYHIAQLGAEALDPAKKASLLWGTYFPFTLIRWVLSAVLMAVDMHFRILARISNLEKKVKSQ